MADQDIVAGLHELTDAVRHPAHDLILAVTAHRGVVEGGGHRSVIGKVISDLFSQRFLAAGPKKFLQIHGVECLHIRLAYGKRKLLAVDRHTKQAAAGDHMVFRGRFTEIFQGGQGPFAQLHFVKDDQRLFPDDGLSRDTGEQGDEITGVDAFIEGPD